MRGNGQTERREVEGMTKEKEGKGKQKGEEIQTTGNEEKDFVCEMYVL